MITPINYEGIAIMAIGIVMLTWKIYVTLQIMKELKKWRLDKKERWKYL